jgi:hypothetical protein
MRAEHIATARRNMHTITDELLTRADLMKLFKVSQPTVLRLEAAGKLQPIRVGSAFDSSGLTLRASYRDANEETTQIHKRLPPDE